MYLHLPIFFILIISACTFVGIAPILVAVATVVLIILHSIQLRNLKAFFRKPGSHRSSEYQGRPPHIFWRIVSDLFQLPIFNGAKLGDATVARAPPLLCHPRNFIV